MADYYSVLARAIVNLDTQDADVRQELYERARNIIVAELRRQDPKISALTCLDDAFSFALSMHIQCWI
jgi:hypothetical protein